MSENVQAMKNMSLSDGPNNLGSAASSSLERKVSLRHDSAVIVFLFDDGRSHVNTIEKVKANVSSQLFFSPENSQSNCEKQLEKMFGGWNATFDYRSSFSNEEQMGILRRHSLSQNEMDFVRISFVSKDDRRRAFGLLDSIVRDSREPRMAARAWLY